VCVYCAVRTGCFNVIQVDWNVVCQISHNKLPQRMFIEHLNHYLQIFATAGRFRMLVISATLPVRRLQASLLCWSHYRKVTFWSRFYRNSCFEIKIVTESAQQLLYNGRPLLHVSATFSHHQAPHIACELHCQFCLVVEFWVPKVYNTFE